MTVFLELILNFSYFLTCSYRKGYFLWPYPRRKIYPPPAGSATLFSLAEELKTGHYILSAFSLAKPSGQMGLSLHKMESEKLPPPLSPSSHKIFFEFYFGYL